MHWAFQQDWLCGDKIRFLNGGGAILKEYLYSLLLFTYLARENHGSGHRKAYELIHTCSIRRLLMKKATLHPIRRLLMKKATLHPSRCLAM